MENIGIALSTDSALMVPLGSLTGVTSIIAPNIDSLVLRGIKNIQCTGERFSAEYESGLQAYAVDYILTNPLNRLHSIREPKSIQYLCREFIAYFNGSLLVHDGLAQASKFWEQVADKNGKIASNYGYYVFHQKVRAYENKTQFEWVIDCLSNNLDTRKAFLNVNQPEHKDAHMRDFPCTIGLQFFVRQGYLCCAVFSRSTDVFTGLPYDMGFFSFLTELVYECLKKRLPLHVAENLKLGYTSMKTNFTQIYDKTQKRALDLLKSVADDDPIFALDDAQQLRMPKIADPEELLNDIYNKTRNSNLSKWLYDHAKLI